MFLPSCNHEVEGNFEKSFSTALGPPRASIGERGGSHVTPSNMQPAKRFFSPSARENAEARDNRRRTQIFLDRLRSNNNADCAVRVSRNDASSVIYSKSISLDEYSTDTWAYHFAYPLEYAYPALETTAPPADASCAESTHTEVSHATVLSEQLQLLSDEINVTGESRIFARRIVTTRGQLERIMQFTQTLLA
ncbi:hypothetical protein CEXT_258101 [Caerostris extrusa]|uniref:Uncharacterized protein n=1 Tax=Caerostris extrusa TaxID=172846 RepID=A0AAV4P466_CAEEX|nr:hypothetical protein CEXT_258101 [Caerostris extrusa]